MFFASHRWLVSGTFLHDGIAHFSTVLQICRLHIYDMNLTPCQILCQYVVPINLEIMEEKNVEEMFVGISI